MQFKNNIMAFKLIKTEADYHEAMERLDQICDAPLGTPENEEAELLSYLVETYEETHHPVRSLNSGEAIRLKMEKSW